MRKRNEADPEATGPEAIEIPWAFEIGDSVDEGEIVWRRENAAGEREYQIGCDWHPESALKAKA